MSEKKYKETCEFNFNRFLITYIKFPIDKSSGIKYFFLSKFGNDLSYLSQITGILSGYFEIIASDSDFLFSNVYLLLNCETNSFFIIKKSIPLLILLLKKAFII